MSPRSLFVLANLGAVTLGAQFVRAAPPASREIKLEGAREASAIISATEREYAVIVLMKPVTVFDDFTNRQLNRDKARMYATQALARYLKGNKALRLTLSRMQDDHGKIEDDRYRLSVTVPIDGVKLEEGDIQPSRGDSRRTPAKEAGKRPASGAKGISKTTRKEPGHALSALDHAPSEQSIFDLFTRKADYEDTIARLRQSLLRDAANEEKNAADADAFYLRVAELEQRTNRLFKACRKEIEQDKLLFSLEQEELRVELGKARDDVLNRLKDAVAAYRTKQKKKEAKP